MPCFRAKSSEPWPVDSRGRRFSTVATLDWPTNVNDPGRRHLRNAHPDARLQLRRSARRSGDSCRRGHLGPGEPRAQRTPCRRNLRCARFAPGFRLARQHPPANVTDSAERLRRTRRSCGNDKPYAIAVAVADGFWRVVSLAETIAAACSWALESALSRWSESRMDSVSGGAAGRRSSESRPLDCRRRGSLSYGRAAHQAEVVGGDPPRHGRRHRSGAHAGLSPTGSFTRHANSSTPPAASEKDPAFPANPNTRPAH